MATDDLRNFLEERIQALDPTIDIAPGSPADTEVISPLLSRLGVDPFSTDIRSFLFARIAEEYPDIDASGAGSELADLLIGPAQLLFEPFRREATAVKFSQSLAAPNRITRAEAEALLANSFSGLQDGEFSYGTARVYFAEARLVVVDAYTYVSAPGGLRYFAVTAQEFTAQDMALNIEGGLYYIDFDVEAESEGPAYDIGPHSLIGVSGLAGAIKVDNQLAFSGGVPAQGLPQALDEAETLISERSPNTRGGITRKLLDQFADIRAVQPIGFNDPEMQRDIIKGTVDIDPDALGAGEQVIAGSTQDVVELDGALLGGAYANGIGLTLFSNLVELSSIAGITARSDDYPGDILFIEGDTLAAGPGDDVTKGRRIVDIDVAAARVTVDDFEVVVPSSVAAGNTGSTFNAPISQISSEGVDGVTLSGAPLIHTSQMRTQKSGAPLVSAISVGDYLKPDPASIGNTNKAGELWKIRQVSLTKVGVEPWVYDYVVGFGGMANKKTGRLLYSWALPPVFAAGAVIHNGPVGQPALATVSAVVVNVVTASNYVAVKNATGEFAAAEVVTDDATTLTLDSVVYGDMYTVTLTKSGGTWKAALKADDEGGPPAGTYDFGNTNTDYGLVNRSPDPASDAVGKGGPVVANDWITLHKDLGGSKLHVCLKITSKDNDRQLTLDDPTDALGTAGIDEAGEEEVTWTIIRTPSGETNPDAAFLKSAPDDGATPIYDDKNFAVIRLSSKITDPEASGHLPPWTLPQTFPFLNPADGAVPFSIYKQKELKDINGSVTLTLSDIPGGLPDPAVGLKVENDKVHIGGMTDVYIHQAATRQLSVVLTAPKSATILAEGTDLAQPAGGAAADLDADDIGNATVPTMSAVVLEKAGTSYRIIRTVGDTITIPEELDPFSGERYHVVSEIELPLSSMKAIRHTGNKLQTALHSKVVKDWTVGTNFVALGVVPGDVVDILEGEDKGQYFVDIVESSQLTLAGVELKANATDLQYRVYTVQTSAENPIARVVKVEMSAGGGTDVEIPYSEPIDIRTTSLENIGNSALVSGTDGATSVDATIVSGVATIANGNASDETVTRYRFKDTSKDFVALGVGPGDILTIAALNSSGNAQVNAGTYTVLEVGNGGNDELFIYSIPPLRETWSQAVETSLSYSIGSPSVGTARIYFDDPTFLEIPASATLETSDAKAFRVDVSLKGLLVDESGTKANAKRMGNAGTDSVRIVGFDFFDRGVEVGDRITLRFYPIISSDPGDANLGFDVKNLTLSVLIEDKDTRTVTFSGTNPILPTIVGGAGGIVDQFNEAFAEDDVTMEVGDGTQGAGSTDKLVIHAGKRIQVLPSTAATLLGFGGSVTNDIGDAGTVVGGTHTFRIANFLSAEEAQLEHLDGSPVTHFPDNLEDRPYKFQIYMEGTLLVGPADLEDNVVNGLFYVDAEIHSLAAGNTFNLDPGTQLTLKGHTSFGWKLRSKLDVETFSDVEDTALVLTPLFLRAGRKADLTKADIAAGKDLVVTYDKAETVGFAHSMLLLDEHRVINNNPLARVMLPVYVRMSINYTGGSSARLVKQDIVDLINSAPSGAGLEVSDLYAILTRRGAKYVQGPLEIIGVSHAVDRTVQVIRSYDKFTIGRTSHMVADEDNIVVTRS